MAESASTVDADFVGELEARPWPDPETFAGVHECSRAPLPIGLMINT